MDGVSRNPVFMRICGHGFAEWFTDWFTRWFTDGLLMVYQVVYCKGKNIVLWL